MGLFGDGIKGKRYRMRERVFGIGDDYWIDDEDGHHAYKVDGKAMRLRKTMVIESASGGELFTVKERKLSLRDKLAIERGDDTVATVKKALIGIGDRYVFDVGDVEYKAKGDFIGHEYEIKRGGDKVVEISKRFFSVRDTYGIHVADGEDHALMIAAAVCIEELAHGD